MAKGQHTEGGWEGREGYFYLNEIKRKCGYLPQKPKSNHIIINDTRSL